MKQYFSPLKAKNIHKKAHFTSTHFAAWLRLQTRTNWQVVIVFFTVLWFGGIISMRWPSTRYKLCIHGWLCWSWLLQFRNTNETYDAQGKYVRIIDIFHNYHHLSRYLRSLHGFIFAMRMYQYSALFLPYFPIYWISPTFIAVYF